MSLRLSNASLTTRFAVYSFICIGVMTILLWFIVSSYLTREMLDREWATTAKFIRAEVRQAGVTQDFMAENFTRLGDKFLQLRDHITTMPDIVRIKLYNAQGVIIWSDESRLIGTLFKDDDELRQALAGKVVANLIAVEKKENVYEQSSHTRLVELYVPIYAEDGQKLVGVVETYKSADTLYLDIRKARWVVFMGAVGGSLLLYLSLFAIVRQAAMQINEQQENLLKVQSELIGSQRMAAIGEMAAAVAHGIGNPLSSIRAAAQLARLDCRECCDSRLQEKTMDTLDRIIQQVDRMQKRMHGLLNIAKPLEPRLAPVEINTLLSDIVEVLRLRFAEASVSPRLDLDRTLPKISLDANHVEQIFMGLITNALEASPKGGTVTIRTRADAGNGAPRSVRVSIEDTGEGIPPESRQRVFEPFFTTKTQGTGIGLPLAKKFVERNGGTISISDAPSGGAKFDVTFPLSGSS